mgnify:CR=1 FL=1
MKLMNKEQMGKIILKLSEDILRENKDVQNLCIVGIQRRGTILGERISKIIGKIKGRALPTGSMDITFYRDDLSRIAYQPVARGTDIPFPVDDAQIILVDDVLYTGRTVRAAIDSLLDLGRPRKVELAVLIDRGHRELPIQPQYVGRKVSTSSKEMVEVRVEEIDGKEEVLLLKRGEK